MTKRIVRALGLCSGGLDSILAGKVLALQGIEVEWITFETPFFSSDKARKAARMAGIPLTVRNITDIYLTMLRNPRCGYGQNMNPCLDCHALMFRLAGEIMETRGFDFLFSGEVLGQRPMSQTRPSLRYVEKHSGFDGRILRPLSAQLLPETLPEQEGLVDRARLLGLSGRSRKPQIQLAEDMGVTDYPAPAGGCLLTDKGYSARLRDLFAHQESCTEADLHLLKYGRQFRLNPRIKIIVGRTKSDNDQILLLMDPNRDTVIRLARLPGPVVLIPGPADAESVRTAAGLCVGYSKVPEGQEAEVQVKGPGSTQTLHVVGVDPGTLRDFML